LAEARGRKQRPRVRHLPFLTVRFHNFALRVCPGPVVSLEKVLSCRTRQWCPLFVEWVVACDRCSSTSVFLGRQSSPLMAKHGTETHTAHRHAGLIGATTTIVGPEGVKPLFYTGLLSNSGWAGLFTRFTKKNFIVILNH